MNILVVDDMIETCKYISQVITENFKNCTCETAVSYDNAINLLQAHKFDIIILDYELDKYDESKNGLSLGKHISAMDTYKNIPIVFATSYPEYIYSAVNSLHCVYYMLKPFDRSDIINMMNKLLSSKSDITKLVFHNSVGIYTMIKASDIAYIQAMRHKITVSTYTNHYTFTNYSLNDIESDSNGQLIRCHKSYLINPDYLINLDRTNNFVQISFNYFNSC